MQRGPSNLSLNSRNQRRMVESNSYKTNPEKDGVVEASVHTGKDFADIVSIETANCSRIQ